MVNFSESKTKENLMRAFAGESQARNRYTFAAEAAKKEKLSIIYDLFNYTADQERAHAEQFMKALKEFSGEEICISTEYPIEWESSTLKLLKSAEKHENAEATEIYKDFAKVAKEEGFNPIATLFENIASIEAIHSKRFSKYAEQLENGNLFKGTTNIKWMCTNCGYIYEGTEAPQKCPVCEHPQGYYITFANSEFE